MVTVNGKVELSTDRKVNPDSDAVTLNGEELSYKKYLYIMLNKPQGVVCSTKDGESPTVLSLLPENFMRKGLFPAGRLDKDTEGFVLITDDGDLSHKMLAPKSHVPKLYYCRLLNSLESDYTEKFAEGIMLASGEKCMPAALVPASHGNDCYVTLNEGMFHQIKRMFEMLGNKVIYLKRTKIGGVQLDANLALGESRELSADEVKQLLIR